MNHQTRARVMTVAAMMIVATTGARGRLADGEEVEDMIMVTVMITEKVMTAGMIMEVGRGRKGQLERGVRMRTRKCQK
jgi:hypothetical protein